MPSSTRCFECNWNHHIEIHFIGAEMLEAYIYSVKNRWGQRIYPELWYWRHTYPVSWTGQSKDLSRKLVLEAIEGNLKRKLENFTRKKLHFKGMKIIKSRKMKMRINFRVSMLSVTSSHSLKFSYLIFKHFFYFMCMEARRWHGMSRNWSFRQLGSTMWVLVI